MKHLNIEQKGSIAIVSIARPDAMNALNQEVLKEFFSLQEHFRKDLDTRVVIFTGEGDHFSAGADLKEKAQLSTKLESWRNNLSCLCFVADFYGRVNCHSRHSHHQKVLFTGGIPWPHLRHFSGKYIRHAFQHQ